METFHQRQQIFAEDFRHCETKQLFFNRSIFHCLSPTFFQRRKEVQIYLLKRGLSLCNFPEIVLDTTTFKFYSHVVSLSFLWHLNKGKSTKP